MLTLTTSEAKGGELSQERRVFGAGVRDEQLNEAVDAGLSAAWHAHHLCFFRSSQDAWQRSHALGDPEVEDRMVFKLLTPAESTLVRWCN